MGGALCCLLLILLIVCLLRARRRREHVDLPRADAVAPDAKAASPRSNIYGSAPTSIYAAGSDVIYDSTLPNAAPAAITYGTAPLNAINYGSMSDAAAAPAVTYTSMPPT